MYVVIANEHVDKHKEKTQLVKQISENKTRLLMIQNILLKRLSETTGNITENEQLLATLKETKNKAVDITQKLEKAPIATVELDALCNEYTQVAKRGSILFFSMTSFSSISIMHEYSLA